MISIAHNGQEVGQFSAEQIADMLKTGLIDRTSHYWVEGMTEWRPIEELGACGISTAIHQATANENINDVTPRIVPPSAVIRIVAATIDVTVMFLVIHGLDAVLDDGWKPREPIILGFVLCYCFLRQAIGGQSLGKYVTRTALVDSRTLKPASLRQCILYNIVLLGPLLVVMLISFMVWKYFSPRLGTLMAGVFPVTYGVYLLNEWVMRPEKPTYAESFSGTRVIKRTRNRTG